MPSSHCVPNLAEISLYRYLTYVFKLICMDFIIKATRQVRLNCLDMISGLTTGQLHAIPEGFNNNLIWHLGHMFVSEQLLCYANSHTPLLIPESYLPLFRKGTSPRDWKTPMDIQELIRYMNLTSEALEQDYANKRFGLYEPYTTSAGVTLTTVNDAIAYSYGHENLHYGMMMSLIKLVK